MKKSSILLLTIPFLLAGCIHTKPVKPEVEHIYESFRSAKAWIASSYSVPLTLYTMKGISKDIPYVDFQKTYNTMFALLGMSFDPYDQGSYKLNANVNGDIINMQNSHGSISFDTKEDTMTVYKVNKFMLLTAKDKDNLIIANGLETNFVCIDEEKTQSISPDTSVTFELGNYDIDIMHEGKTLYMPAATFNDLFMAINGLSLVYNGVDYYFSNTFNDNPSGIGADDLELKYYEESTWRGKQRSQELATFTYNELCLALDNLYGLKDYRNIESFDSLFTSAGWKTGLLSTNPDTYERTMIDFVSSYLCEGHTNYTKISSFNYGNDYTEANAEAHNQNDRYAALRDAKAELTESREAAGYEPGLTLCDNVAIIRFDQFVKAGQNTSGINTEFYSYSYLHEADTYLFFKKAFNDIKKNSQIDKVIIDITCNGGGMMDALPWLEAFMSDDPFLTIRSSLTGQVTDTHYKVDLNQDGVYDENDTYKGQYDFYLLTSSFSFSCGNALPTVVKKGQMATIIGEKSGGGACAVGALSTASGTVLRLSSTMQMGMLNDQNQFVINEGGIEVDHVVDRSNFYQNTSLAEIVNNL